MAQQFDFFLSTRETEEVKQAINTLARIITKTEVFTVSGADNNIYFNNWTDLWEEASSNWEDDLGV